MTPLHATPRDEGSPADKFLSGNLPKNTAILLALLVFSRIGVYIRLPGVDVDAFAANLQSSGLQGYVDALSGGSISRVGLFSLGIVPYINASILLHLLATMSPYLKRMQREEGRAGRARFELYQKLAALGFAAAQALVQLAYLRPYAPDPSASWLATNSLLLTMGAMTLIFVADSITELKLGNGASVLVFANIASGLPASLGSALAAAGGCGPGALAASALAALLTTLGIVYVQEGERQIPLTYASRYRARGLLRRQAYLPFKVNATGVMPVILASSMLAALGSLAHAVPSDALSRAVGLLAPGGRLSLPATVALVAGFNCLHTLLQIEPEEVSEQLKKQGASIPGIRPGRRTADFVAGTLTRMSVLGSAFLGILAIAPTIVEELTGVAALRGLVGTSVLILVGVATDTAHKFRAEMVMGKYGEIDALYDDL